MCLVTGIIKCILGIVVGIILTAGLVLMAVGGILLWGMNSIMPRIYDITGYLKKLLANLHVNTDGVKSIETMISANSATIGAIAFSIGVLLTAIAILGYLSLCCFGMKCLFYVIIAIINALLISLLVLTIVYGSSGNKKIFDTIESGLDKLIKGYVGYNATNVESLIINVVQTQVHCCGLYNYKDFQNAPNWVGLKLGYKFPLSCCESKDMRYVDINECTKYWTSPSLDKGCYSSIKPEIERYLKYAFLTLGLTITILAVLDVLFILYLICENRPSK